MNQRSPITGAAVLAIVLAACAPADQNVDAGDAAQPAATALTPDTTAASLLSHLETGNYQSWSLWPGRDRLYAGGDPHGMLLTTYVNDIASSALASGAVTMPPGAIVVKENFMPDSTLAAVTVMHKVTGYDSGAGDWFWAKYNMPGSVVEASGRVAMCQGCHASAMDRDYLVTPRQ